MAQIAGYFLISWETISFSGSNQLRRVIYENRWNSACNIDVHIEMKRTMYK
jgi:hypothetical protein